MMISFIRRYLPGFKELPRNPIAYLKKNPLLVSSTAFFLSSTFVNLGNYLFNLIIGRALGPVLFADISLIITLMLVTTFLTMSLSTTIAWFAAVSAADQDLDHVAALRAWCLRNAYVMGGIAAVALILGAGFLQTVFHMSSFWPFIILGLGFPVFFLLAVERGILQGRAFFGWLSFSNQAEMWVRLLGAIAAVAAGWSIYGIVGAISVSFLAGWLFARHGRKGLPAIHISLSPGEQTRITHYFGPVIIGLMGQILINNSDILIVKSFFLSQEAGLYTALALIGRIVYFATWSIVVVLFPLMAQKYQRGEAHRPWLWTMCGIIIFISGSIVLLTFFMPKLVIQILFGSAYLPIAPLLWLYALATAFYTLANAITNYYLSLGNGIGNYIVLCTGIAQIIGLLIFHQSLFIVVCVQVILMAGLLLVLLFCDFYLKYQYVQQAV
jgi:O-antigen/teichoic acid export membrane protein